MKYDIPWLIATRAQHPVHYLFFWGHRPRPDGRLSKSVFSQWWPCTFTHEGHTYRSAEHWMMAAKARLFQDAATEQLILSADTPLRAKQLGRKVRDFDPAVWDTRKYAIVLQGTLLKFAQDSALRAFLLATGDQVIVEASPDDSIWGIGMAEQTPDVEDPATWLGTNLLGFALMEARDILRVG